MRAAPLALPPRRDMEVALDGEEPRPEVAIASPQRPSRQRPFERVLHEIVGRVVVAHQRVGIPAQRGDQRLEEGFRIGHGVTLQEGGAGRIVAGAGIPDLYLATCQAPFRKPSPVVSPALVSLAKA